MDNAFDRFEIGKKFRQIVLDGSVSPFIMMVYAQKKYPGGETLVPCEWIDQNGQRKEHDFPPNQLETVED